MTQLWCNIVDNPREVLTEYFHPIMKGLLKSIVCDQWRERQSSCLAISDLISGRSFDVLETYLEELWIRIMRAFDDIKTTVREAASEAVKILTKISERLCNTSITPTNECKRAIAILLPHLLRKGIMNDADAYLEYTIQEL